MALRDWIDFTFDPVANAIPAKVAILEEKAVSQLAGIARLALAKDVQEKLKGSNEVFLEDDCGSDSCDMLPTWCSRSCPNFEEISQSGGKLLGCMSSAKCQGESWTNLEALASCPQNI